MFSCYFIVTAVALLHIGRCIENEWQHTVLINPFNGTRNDTCYNSGGGSIPSGQITCEDINAGFQFRNSSTRFILRPGRHYLSSPVPFKSVNQLAIFGDNESDSVVVCETGTGFSFINSTDITLQWVTYLGCAVLQNSTSKNFSTDVSRQSGLRLQTFLVGFYFYQCHDVDLDHITIANSSANGLVLYDTVGTVKVMNSIFYNNSVGSNHSGGGGVSIEFSFCKPGDEKCDNSHFQGGNNSHSTYIFHNCDFTDNKANIADKYQLVSGFIAPYWSNHEALGHGGGLSLYFKGTATNNTFTIANCSFRHNHAVWGGGLIVEFQDNSTANFVNITSCHFERNHCFYDVKYGTGGGAVRVSMFNYFGLTTASHWNGNQVLIQNNHLEKNRALNGGAISIVGALQSETRDEHITRVDISNCTFVNNFGRLGSAINIHLLFILSKGKMPQVDISDCVFTNNTVKYLNTTLYDTGIGAVYVSDIPVTFLSSIHFENNTGSALAAFNTQLNFSNCRVMFKSNHGKDGGAIALLGAAYLLINDSTNMTFVKNTAEQRGGAIFNMYVSKNSMKTSTGCFLRYETPFISKWKAHFTFDQNSAGRGKSIFSTSILPCGWNFGSGITKDIKKIFCSDEEHWNYSGQNCTDEIYTEASSFHNISDPVLVLPGQEFSLPITVHDDMSHDITKQVVYRASIQKKSIARVDPKFAYVANNELTITGLNQSDNQSIVLMLDTVGPPVWHIEVNVQIQPCPPGLTRNTTGNEKWNTTCVCSKNYGGHLQCATDDESYEVSIKNGFWIGNVSDLVLMGECVHCRTDNKSNFYQLQNISFITELDSYICGVNKRTGILCGKCIEDYGPAVNSWNFDCIACNSSDVAKNTIKYFFSTYIPLFFLFLAVILFKVQLTTGPANAFVLYAQLISSAVFDVNAGGVIASSSVFSPHTMQWMLDAYHFVYGIFNLEFISYSLEPYCLTPTFNSLDILQIQYFVAIFPLLMIIAVILFLKVKESCLGRCLGRCFSQCTRRFQNQTTNTRELEGESRERSGWMFADSLLHAFVAFILLSYTKFATSSTFILGTTALFGEDGNPIGSRRMYYAGQYHIDQKEYFYTYALPAIIVLGTFVALPPLLLLGPLQWFNQLVVPRVSCLRRYWPSLKVNIVLDAFQGCYKPHTRFFAGLYFVFRVAVLVNYGATASFFQQFIIQQILVTVMIALLAIFQPYRRQLFNYVDTLIFVNMAIMNSLSVFIYMSSELNPQAPFPVAVFIVLYILVYLPLVYIIGYILYYSKLHYLKSVTQRLKLWYEKCCCKKKDLSSQPLLEAATGNIQRSDYGSLIDDASLLMRAEEANTFRASPSIRRAVGLDNNTTNVTGTKKDENSNSDPKCLPLSDQDSGLRSTTMNTTPASTQ